MFYAESGYPAASEAYSSNLEYGERYERWLDPDSPLGRALATFRRKIAAGGADVGIAAFAENCKVGRI
jgi:hypothetical protein